MKKGSCLCGAVRFEIAGVLDHPPDACHCSMCRKQTSYAFVSTNANRTALTIHDSGNKLSWYRSSGDVRRGFCSNCGAALFWEPNPEKHDVIAVSMGAIEAPTGLRLAKHIFVRDKGDYYDIGDGLPQRDGY